MPTILSGLGDLTLANRTRPHLSWPSRAMTHVQVHFALRREFRPLGPRYFAAHLFTCLTSVQRKRYLIDWGPCCAGFLVWVWVLVLLSVVLVWFLFLSPINMLRFLSFYDDLGAPPTWRPYSCKKNDSAGRLAHRLIGGAMGAGHRVAPALAGTVSESDEAPALLFVPTGSQGRRRPRQPVLCRLGGKFQ